MAVMVDLRQARGERLVAERSHGIYETLRREIVTGVLRPNERLVETELAERLVVSRTPIRESMQRLAAEGLVSNPRRAWVVHEHTHHEIRDLYEVRAGLEGFAAGLAASRARPEQLELVDRVCNEPCDDDPGHSIFVDVNERFHSAVVAAANNPRLALQVRQSRQFYFNHRIAAAYSNDEVQSACDDHRAIVAALLAGDAARAEHLTRRHISDALELALLKLG
jgi:DNA-binding GntR family transcriptional regulator